MKLVSYIRVSTEEQASSGLSLEYQRQAIAAYCVAMDHHCIEEFEDAGVSAKTLNREALGNALQIAMSAADGLIVLKLDRLTRSVRDLADLMDQFNDANRALVSVRDNLDTTTASGRLVANILGATAQWEREIISERTKDALAIKRAQGVILGRPPRIRMKDCEIAWLMRDSGHYTYREIAHFMSLSNPSTAMRMIKRYERHMNEQDRIRREGVPTVVSDDHRSGESDPQ